MKPLIVKHKKAYCKFCGCEMECNRHYLANPFCNCCYDERIKKKREELRSKGIIGIRRIDIGNGYARIELIYEGDNNGK